MHGYDMSLAVSNDFQLNDDHFINMIFMNQVNLYELLEYIHYEFLPNEILMMRTRTNQTKLGQLEKVLQNVIYNRNTILASEMRSFADRMNQLGIKISPIG
ncbi:hypothetical protein D3C75_1148780 [compost metagenome]